MVRQRRQVAAGGEAQREGAAARRGEDRGSGRRCGTSEGEEPSRPTSRSYEYKCCVPNNGGRCPLLYTRNPPNLPTSRSRRHSYKQSPCRPTACLQSLSSIHRPNPAVCRAAFPRFRYPKAGLHRRLPPSPARCPRAMGHACRCPRWGAWRGACHDKQRHDASGCSYAAR